MLTSILTMALAQKPASDPGWPVGWGFASHGGFPALPAAWQSYSLQESTVGFFLGNASGMDSAAEEKAEVRLGVVGIGWQLNNIPSHHSNLETFEIEEAQRLKALRPGVRVMLTRESEATTTLYNSAKAKMFDPATQDWWVQCGNAPCNGTWNSPAGNTPKYFFNFTNRDAADWWVNEFIGAPLRSPLVDGIYFDSAPVAGPPDHGNGQGGGPGRADAQAAFDRALKLIASMGKWASAWNNDGQSLFPKQGLQPDAKDYSRDSCSSLMKEWIRLGRRTSHTLQIQVGTLAPRNETLAAFLVARGASAILEYPIGGTYSTASDYGFPALMAADFGKPAGDALEVHPGVFRREWTKATVELDCHDLSSSFDFH
jgi:hypothetical protein